MKEPNKTAEQLEAKVQRKLKARQNDPPSSWFGLGMFGLVGWSVTVPSLLGITLGWWLDNRWPDGVSWTITCMFVGLVLGCINAWRWVRRESGE